MMIKIFHNSLSALQDVWVINMLDNWSYLSLDYTLIPSGIKVARKHVMVSDDLWNLASVLIAFSDQAYEDSSQ